MKNFKLFCVIGITFILFTQCKKTVPPIQERPLPSKHLFIMPEKPADYIDTHAKLNKTVAFGVPNSNSKGYWRNIGPFGVPEVYKAQQANGAAEHVVFHPDNPEIMYKSIRHGGLFKTTNSTFSFY